MTRPIPNQKAPELSFKLTDEAFWILNEQNPKSFTLVSFYRGLHCPVCRKHLQQLHELIPEFENEGVNIVAVSMDGKTRAKKAQQEWHLQNLPIGYNLTLESAKKWGLYISRGIKDSEPDIFNEPGIFLIDTEGLVYYSAMYSNPWGRPSIPAFLKGLQYIKKTKYPPRGEVI